MTTDNLRLWNAVSRPPVQALKSIQAGRLKGKSDINPQWRYKAMTEQFGPCGAGWKFTIDRLWSEKGAGDVLFCFAQVSVYINVKGEWSAPIPGIGGSQLVSAEKSGAYNNDEGYKMATTDALGVAMKMLGVAAEIYEGNFDGTKYRTPPPQSPEESQASLAAQYENQKKAMALLGPASDEGLAALEKAWKAMPKEYREAAKGRLPSLKELRRTVRCRERGEQWGSMTTPKALGVWIKIMNWIGSFAPRKNPEGQS